MSEFLGLQVRKLDGNGTEVIGAQELTGANKALALVQEGFFQARVVIESFVGHSTPKAGSPQSKNIIIG